MDIGIKRLLGIAGDEKRIYRFVDGDVEKEEYFYCQLLDQLVFGEKGFVDTLGQTWEMIHDPRFIKIESTFIVNRKAYFGGDARTGKQYQSSDGVFVSTISDLEEYSEVLGEGRYFWIVLTHPEERCPVRLWYERIYPEMIAKKCGKAPQAGDLKCVCSPLFKTSSDPMQVRDPRLLKDAPDEWLWALIKMECPNYFNQGGSSNQVAQRLFNLFRADLVGLIADYSPTPLVDAYIELESGDVIHDNDYSNPMDQPPRVFLEVDLLEKALTYRATMRATAAKILMNDPFLHKWLQESGIYSEGFRITDSECDLLLHYIYQSDWPDGKVEMANRISNLLSIINKMPYEDRLKDQLVLASTNALDMCQDLLNGKLEPINSYTEPKAEVQLDPHAAVMEALLKDPLKQELFLIWASAEDRSHNSRNEADRVNMAKLYSILTPVFTDPGFEVTDDAFWWYMDQAKRLGYYGAVPIFMSVKEDLVPNEEEFYKSRRLRESRGEKRTPLPLEETEGGLKDQE